MKSLAKYLAVGSVLLVAAVTVHAQDAAPKPLPASDMVKNAAAFNQQIDDDAKQMQHLQAVVRKEKDVVKLTCVNDALVELNAQRNLYDDNNAQFEAAVEADPETARPYYLKLSETAAAVKTLRGDAEACVGVTDLYKQESDVQVTHPDFPDDPTVDDPFVPEVETPAYASPFA